VNKSNCVCITCCNTQTYDEHTLNTNAMQPQPAVFTSCAESKKEHDGT